MAGGFEHAFRRGPRRHTTMTARLLILSLGAAVATGSVLIPAAGPLLGDEGVVERGDVSKGWHVLHKKRCVHCHAVWGQGGQIGPDLGRTSGDHLSASQLAGGLWNHVPRMLALMKQYQLPEVTLTQAEMDDLFAFLYFVRYLDPPGDPRRGSRILERKRCTECHALEHGDDEIGPDLTRWTGFVNPIVWAQMMWEHGAGMEKAMKQAGIEWPELDDDDLANIIAFIRSVGTSSKKEYLRPGSSAQGQRLFSERGCAVCHLPDSEGDRVGPDLARIDLPRSMSALASRMWNHQPAMRRVMTERKVEAASLTAQEMADIITYLFAKQYEGAPGDPLRGGRVFEQKRCAECHVLSATEEASAVRASAAGMAHSIWQHGARMAEGMAQAGIPWPIFEGTEMTDLIAFIKATGALTTRAQPISVTETGAPE